MKYGEIWWKYDENMMKIWWKYDEIRWNIMKCDEIVIYRSRI